MFLLTQIREQVLRDGSFFGHPAHLFVELARLPLSEGFQSSAFVTRCDFETSPGEAESLFRWFRGLGFRGGPSELGTNLRKHHNQKDILSWLPGATYTPDGLM